LRLLPAAILPYFVARIPGQSNLETACCLPCNRRDTNADTAAFVENLRTHRYQALVLDTATIMDMAAHAENCDLFPIGGAFQKFDLSVAFPQDAPDCFISNVSASMVRLQVR
jgi:hypothetical protein